MPFTPKTWADGVAGGTPVTAAELNRIEAGIAEASGGGAGTVQTRTYVGGAWELRGDQPAGTVILWLKRDPVWPDPPVNSTHVLDGVDIVMGATDAGAAASTGYRRSFLFGGS